MSRAWEIMYGKTNSNDSKTSLPFPGRQLTGIMKMSSSVMMGMIQPLTVMAGCQISALRKKGALERFQPAFVRALITAFDEARRRSRCKVTCFHWGNNHRFEETKLIVVLKVNAN